MRWVPFWRWRGEYPAISQETTHALDSIFVPLLACSGFSLAGWADPPPGYPFVGHDAGLARAKAEAKPILLYFGRYGCAWCDHVNRKTFSDPGLKQLFSEHYVLI